METVLGKLIRIKEMVGFCKIIEKQWMLARPRKQHTEKAVPYSVINVLHATSVAICRVLQVWLSCGETIRGEKVASRFVFEGYWRKYARGSLYSY